MQPRQLTGILDTRGIGSIQSPDGGPPLSDSKRTGNRDISELKQRLGLKKGGPAAGQNRGSSGQTAGIAPPPGLAPVSPFHTRLGKQKQANPGICRACGRCGFQR